jgi:phosphatidate cytidylyltransferase
METAGSPTRAATAPSKGAVFVRRLLSSLVLWAVVVGALFAPDRMLSGFLFLLAMMTLAGTGLAEFYGLMDKRGLACFKEWGIVGGLLLMGSSFAYLSGALGTHDQPAKANDFETGFLVLFVLGLCVRQFLSRTNPSGLVAISTTLFGLMYVPYLLNFFQKIIFFPRADGRMYLIYFLVVTKCSDMGAYAVGSLIGRHKLIPRVSPGKTWEGLGGAVLWSTAASVAFAAFGGSRLAGLSLVHAVVLGVVLSLAAVVGDLIESLFKREAGVKDSGGFIPGIGGILDLLDSLLFNAPLMYLYLRHILTH